MRTVIITICAITTGLIVSFLLGEAWYRVANDPVSNASLIVLAYSTVSSLVMGLISIPLTQVLLLSDRWQRTVITIVAAALTTGLSYLSWALSWWYSPDLPLFPIWLIANLITVSLAYLLTRRFNSQQAIPLMLSRRTRITWVVALAAVLLSLPANLATHLWVAQHFVQSEIYLIPSAYTGPVLVLFNQQSGQLRLFEDSARVYRVPESGVVRTQFTPQRAWYKPIFYYVNTSGERILITRGTDDCSERPPDDRIIVCTKGSGYIVTKYDDIYTNTVAYQDMVQHESHTP